MTWICTVCHKEIHPEEKMIMYDIMFWEEAESTNPQEIAELYFHVKCNPIYFDQLTKRGKG